MYKSLIIIDDFYVDPLLIRRKALAEDYPPVTGQRTFPGRNSARPFLPPQFDRAVSTLVGEAVVDCARPRSFHGHFRITLAGEESRYLVHVDPSFLYWVGVVYLSLPGDYRGGTSFYRHKALASDRTPLSQAELAPQGVADVAALLQRDGRDPACWERVMTVPMRFNRLILYRPWLWHSAEPGFGDRPDNARLIQALSFERGPPPAAG